MWVIITLICALTLALSDATAKDALRTVDDRAAGWLRLVFALPLLVPVILYSGIPRLDRTFYLALLAALPFEIAAYYLYNRALKLSPMGLTIPFQSLTPVFLIGVGYIITGESISSAAGIAGIALISVGGYVLNLSSIAEGALGPIRAIVREKGALMMIAVAALYSVTASLLKVAVLHSEPLFLGAVYYMVLVLAYAPVGLPALRKARLGKRELRMLMLSGALMALMEVTNMVAFAMTKVAYMIAVKRTSLLMSVVLGRLFFNERGLRERLPGALLMFGGFIVLLFASQ